MSCILKNPCLVYKELIQVWSVLTTVLKLPNNTLMWHLVWSLDANFVYWLMVRQVLFVQLFHAFLYIIEICPSFLQYLVCCQCHTKCDIQWISNLFGKFYFLEKIKSADFLWRYFWVKSICVLLKSLRIICSSFAIVCKPCYI